GRNAGACNISSENGVADRRRLGVDDAVDADGLAGVGTDLEQGSREAAVQQFGAVEVGLVGNAVDFRTQLLDLCVQSRTVRSGVGCVGGLHRQFADTLQVVADFGHCAFSGLCQRDAVVGVAHSLVQAADL